MNRFSRSLMLLAAVYVCAGGHLAMTADVVSAQTVSGTLEYKVLATSRTSTMEKELNEAAAQGFQFHVAMGGETAGGGKEVVVIMKREAGTPRRFAYKLLATNRTSTMQKELQAASEEGFDYRSQTVFDSLFGGREVVCILERDRDVVGPSVWDYRLVATSRTSTLQKEIQQTAAEGYEVLGMTVGQTLTGGRELIAITRKQVRRP